MKKKRVDRIDDRDYLNHVLEALRDLCTPVKNSKEPRTERIKEIEQRAEEYWRKQLAHTLDRLAKDAMLELSGSKFDFLRDELKGMYRDDVSNCFHHLANDFKHDNFLTSVEQAAAEALEAIYFAAEHHSDGWDIGDYEITLIEKTLKELVIARIEAGAEYGKDRRIADHVRSSKGGKETARTTKIPQGEATRRLVLAEEEKLKASREIAEREISGVIARKLELSAKRVREIRKEAKEAHLKKA